MTSVSVNLAPGPPAPYMHRPAVLGPIYPKSALPHTSPQFWGCHNHCFDMDRGCSAWALRLIAHWTRHVEAKRAVVCVGAFISNSTIVAGISFVDGAPEQGSSAVIFRWIELSFVILCLQFSILCECFKGSLLLLALLSLLALLKYLRR